jgi:hypothetical protein
MLDALAIRGASVSRTEEEAISTFGGCMLGIAIALGLHYLPACSRPPVTPVQVDASPDGGCAVLDEITVARLIRNPDGTALVIHCDAGPP